MHDLWALETRKGKEVGKKYIIIFERNLIHRKMYELKKVDNFQKKFLIKNSGN